MKITVSTPTRLGLLALACVSALTIAACGGGGDPASAAEDFGDAIVDGDGQAACDALSAELEQQAADSAGGSCADAFGADALTDEDRAKGQQAEYATVEESEDTATVEVTVPGDDPQKINMVNEDGDWKVASI